MFFLAAQLFSQGTRPAAFVDDSSLKKSTGTGCSLNGAFHPHTLWSVLFFYGLTYYDIYHRQWP